MKSPSNSLETNSIHGGNELAESHGMVGVPIFQTSTFTLGVEQKGSDVRYTRLNNGPNHLALQKKVALIEGVSSAVLTGSGMGAISTTLLTTLGKGGHLLLPMTIYGGTYGFVNEYLPMLGHSYDFVDVNNPSSWEKALKSNSRVFWIESISNPTLQIPDFKNFLEFCKAHRLISVIDNTFMSPYNFKPLELGFDLVVESCTKYLNGHSDIIAGSVAGRSEELVGRIRSAVNLFGCMLDPHACFLLDRGIKTLSARMRMHNENTLELARFLETHSSIEKVIYPGLESHPHHLRAQEYFKGFSGMLCFEIKGDLATTEKFLTKLKLPKIAPSLGGVESLVCLPNNTFHSAIGDKHRAEMGITKKLIRMSVGLEAVEDLKADIEQALR